MFATDKFHAASAAEKRIERTKNTDDIVWKRWCRLCAKEDDVNNVCLFTEVGETIKSMDTTLATAIGKFFWVNIKPNDDLSNYVCVDCHTLMSSLTHFTERVNKVQAMFCALQNAKKRDAMYYNEIKSQYGLLDEEFEHVIKNERKTKEAETNEETVWEIEAEDEADNKDIKILELEAENRDTEILELETENKDAEILELEADEESKSGAEYEIEFVRRDDRKKYTSDEAFEDEAFQPHIISLSKLVEGSEGGDDEEVEEEHIVFEKVNEAQLDDAELLHQLMGDDDEENDNGKSGTTKETTKAAPKKQNSKKRENKAADNFEEEEQLILNEEVLENDDEATATDTDHNITTQQVEMEVVVEKSAQVNKVDSSSQVVSKKRARPNKQIQSDDCDDENCSTYKYECRICHRKYINPTSYRKHTLEKHDKEPDIPDFKCATCNIILPTERQLEIHQRTHLALVDKLDVPCPYCERKFTKKAVMRQHVRGVHENCKPFICDICGRSAKTLAALAEHKLVHTNETPYECGVCHRAFKNKARLKVHLETHADSAFICTECGLKLNTRRTLKMHMLVHSDAKRYKCDFCPAAFKRTKALKNHLILHTGMRPYKCNFCDKAFSNGSNCRSHKKKMHAEELAEEEAMGKKAAAVTVPKLEELRQSTNVVGNPRKVQRYNGGLSLHMREMLIAAEERVKREEANEIEQMEIINDDDEIQTAGYVSPAMEFETENDMKNAQLQQRLLVDGDDDDNEMVVYEIIAEI
ncbi:zinc finger protein weckle [Eurosta solidaginis]|uniref:zinc finger protein weckle n=1 Tax=Eurosta solidaginis TaxID=178769 RepID=UPI0035316A96